MVSLPVPNRPTFRFCAVAPGALTIVGFGVVVSMMAAVAAKFQLHRNHAQPHRPFSFFELPEASEKAFRR
jgi:hypothetical protein